MTPATPIHHTESALTRANAAFRIKDFESSIAIYEVAISQAVEPLKSIIRFNLELAFRRLGRLSTPTAAVLAGATAVANQFASYELSIGTDEQFLVSLFVFALGREPQTHEKHHYLNLLSNEINGRSAVEKIIFESEEYKRHSSTLSNNGNPRRGIFRTPLLGEIKPDSIKLPYSENPRVSVLIPVYGKVEYTLACLKSIANCLPKNSFEVIVLDDRTPDDSVHILRQIENLNVIVNSENFGFLRSCNSGAHHARGEYLFFLNNDTQVTPGWLDELLSTFDVFPNCGLAGSKLIYPDGLLQEAGGIVWQDGSAWNYGSRQDPNQPQFNYARQVDYISGAAIMVSAKLWMQLGGFDDAYAPAYYEDTDLAMRIHDQGLQVIYQPLSEVVHFEGISSGTDTGQGIKAYQVINGEKFLQRWRDTLSKHRRNGVDPHLEKDRNVVGRVLFIDACTPTPDQDSGSIDSYNLMKTFIGMGWAVTFIPEDNYAYMKKYTQDLQRIGVQMLYQPHINSVDDHITANGSIYDLVMTFRPTVTHKHIHNLRLKCHRAKIVFNTVDLHFLRLEREAKLKNDKAIEQEAEKIKAIELELMNQVDLTTVVSSTELEILMSMGVERVVHLPFSREVRPSSVPFEARTGIIFVGGFQHNPNVDAVRYFVAEIMPLLRDMIPGVVFNIVGSKAPIEIQDLACGDIVVHGFVENLEAVLDTVRVNVAPLRYGAGTKGKVIHALACGLPTVATSIAVEGMGLREVNQVGIADNPAEFAQLVKNFYGNPKLWNDIAVSGVSYADRNYGIAALKNNLHHNVVNKVLIQEK